MSRRYDRDLCQSCAKWPYDCPWIREAEEKLEMMQLLSNPVPCCTDYEEERR